MTDQQASAPSQVDDDHSPSAPATPPSSARWRRFVPSERALWSTVVEVLQICSSTLVFLVLADVFTTETYGIMSGSIGAVAPALALSNLGTHVLLTRRAARGQDLASAWNRALTLGIASPTVATVVLLALHPVLFPGGNVPWSVFALFALAGLPFFWLGEMVAFLPIGLGDIRTVAVVRFVTLIVRVIALGWFVVFSDGTLLQWASVHAASFAVASIAGVFIIGRKYNLRPGLGTNLAADVKEGLPFSMSFATETIFDGSDRVLLVRYGHEDDAGLYGLGGRITQFGYAPIRILLRSRDAELHRAGGESVAAAVGVARTMFLPGLALGCAAAATGWVAAPLVPTLFGSEWDEAVPVIRLLAFLPALRSVQYLVGNTITAFDRQPWRFGATAMAAVLNVVLNVLFLPNGGWRTAVTTTFVSEVFLVLALMWVVWYWFRRDTTPPSASGAADAGPAAAPATPPARPEVPPAYTAPMTAEAGSIATPGRQAPVRVLFVCTANICRSPMAESLFQMRADDLGIPVVAQSAGFLFDGRPAERNSHRAVAAYGGDLDDHRSRIVTDIHLPEYDAVFCMEAHHVQTLVVNGAQQPYPMLFLDAARRGPIPFSDGPAAVRGWVEDRYPNPTDLIPISGDLDVSDPHKKRFKHFERCAYELRSSIFQLLG